MNFNSIEKNNKLKKKKNSVIDCFSDESTLSSKSDIDEVANIHSKKNELNILKKRVNVNDRKNQTKYQPQHLLYHHSMNFIYMLKNSK